MGLHGVGTMARWLIKLTRMYQLLGFFCSQTCLRKYQLLQSCTHIQTSPQRGVRGCGLGCNIDVWCWLSIKELPWVQIPWHHGLRIKDRRGQRRATDGNVMVTNREESNWVCTRNIRWVKTYDDSHELFQIEVGLECARGSVACREKCSLCSHFMF